MEKAQGITWDLSALYSSDTDPKIEQDIETAQKLAQDFQQKYHGKISGTACDATLLLNALQDYENLLAHIYRPYAMASLLFSGDGRSDTYKAFITRVQDLYTKINNTTLFFSLEIQKIEQEHLQKMLTDERLKPYSHHLHSLRLFTPYTLSEREEQLINHKNLTGKTAFVNLFNEFTSSFEWQFEIDGETKTMTESDLRQLVRSADAELRRRAKAALDGKYGENALIFTNIFGNLIRDHAGEMELRGYDSPIQPSYLRNDVPGEVVETMMRVTAEHYHLARSYYTIKARLLGVPRLAGSDLYAPIDTSETKIPFEQGKELVLDSFTAFSAEFGSIMQRAFDERWIDAEIRPGKRGGAFCHGILPSVHPYVLLNYVDNLDSVYTMAHELGHALHDVLSAEKQTLLTYHPPLVLAETASVFAEMLLTKKLLREETDQKRRIQIIASKLEDFFGTISRQTMYTYFELDAHLEGAKRRLSAEDFSQLWLKRRDEMYGDVVDFLPEEKWFWAVIPHFIHTRFYCYAYTFGALLVLALYDQYEKEGEPFVPKYRALLAAGDSDTPENLIRSMGMDFRDENFWRGGFRVISDLLEELQALV